MPSVNMAADRVRHYFVTQFWAGDHFAEFWNPEHGFISNHGITDTDWAAIATGFEKTKIIEGVATRVVEEREFEGEKHKEVPQLLRHIQEDQQRVILRRRVQRIERGW